MLIARRSWRPSSRRLPLTKKFFGTESDSFREKRIVRCDPTPEIHIRGDPGRWSGVVGRYTSYVGCHIRGGCGNHGCDVGR